MEEGVTMITIRCFTKDRWNDSLTQYVSTISPVLIVDETASDIIQVYFNKLMPKWLRYIRLELKYYFIRLGLTSHTNGDRLSLYYKTIAFEDNGLLVLTNFNDYGITKEEIVDLITKATKSFIDRRGLEC